MIFIRASRYFLLLVLSALTIALPYSQAISAQVITTQPDTSEVLIFQVQTSGLASASNEFIAFTNVSDDDVDITNWSVQYITASGKTVTNLATFKTSQPSGFRLYLRAHSVIMIASNEFVSYDPSIEYDATFNGGISSAGGHIKIVDSNSNTVDMVGYGNASQPLVSAAPTHVAGDLIQRNWTPEMTLQDTRNNGADFHVTLSEVSHGGSGTYEVPHEPEEQPPLVINEVLPNPAGADLGKEFIELYNPNDVALGLEEYSLQLGASAKAYRLPKVSIAPRTHLALSDAQTGVTLPNTSTTLLLIDGNGQAIDEMPTYSEPKEDVAWARNEVTDTWLYSLQPSPGIQNSIVTQLDCLSGQTWDEISSACLSAPTQSIPKPCSIGKVRNPDTGRCVNSKTLEPKKQCDTGLKINPQTGRCKKIVQSTVKACPAGQERNAQTNRCRKSLSKNADTKTQVNDVKHVNESMNTQLLAAGLAGTGSVGYVSYEWRQEIRRKVESIVTLLRSR
jgi:Lamin Tail Domain